MKTVGAKNFQELWSGCMLKNIVLLECKIIYVMKSQFIYFQIKSLVNL